MDILKILEESGKELYKEDLDFFETELATSGEFDESYISRCKTKINELRTWLAGLAETPVKKQETEPKPAPKGLVIGIGEVAPKIANPSVIDLSPAQLIASDIEAMRKLDSYKSSFKNYVAGKDEIDADFIDLHYSLFKPWELDAIISVKQMPEDFLEKYFGALDHDKIARYQRFSESFFMKHFSQMDADIVLKHGKNEWRKKENRSKQLDVFLRLKGVKI